jgi:hypothetical protein
MRNIKWQVIFALSLILISALLFSLHYYVYKDGYNLFFYLFHGIAFIPIQVIIVGLILDGILERKEKQKVMKKLNMVIGLFFSEVGSEFVRTISCHDMNLYASMDEFQVKEEYTIKDLQQIKEKLCQYQGHLKIEVRTLEKIKKILSSKREFLIKLIENPVLLEHDTFTELLMAIFHISEEFGYREDIKSLSEKDIEHLGNDVSRAYNYIVVEWIVYIIYLKKEYPYLYKSAILTNPFLDAGACSI